MGSGRDNLSRILAVPGGGSSAHGYFPELAALIEDRARVLEFDAPGHDVESERRWLRARDQARFLADAVRRDGDGRVLVVGHSLGGVVSLRLAVDFPDVVGGLLLLDPSPPLFGLLLPAKLLRLVGLVRRPFRRRPRRPVPAPRALPLATRVRWYLSDGFALAADLAAADLAAIPTVVVSAGAHPPESSLRRTHVRLAGIIPGARLEVWEGTTHALHPERPQEVAATALALLDRIG